MFHQRSSRTRRLLVIGALHFFLNQILVIAAVATIGCFFYQGNLEGIYLGLGIAGLWLLSQAIFILRSPKLACSLCMSPIWGGTKSQKHKKVRPALGISYRLGVASAVLFRGWYRCPYCGESFSVWKTRERPGSGR